MTETINWFICEEGFGHVVRSCSLIEDFLRNTTSDNITVEIFCGDKNVQITERLSVFHDRIRLHEISSNIKLHKTLGLYLDHHKSLQQLIKWEEMISGWLESVLAAREKNTKCLLVVSDSVPQAQLLAEEIGCKCIGISHFTWDWMYQSINTKPSIHPSVSDHCVHYRRGIDKMLKLYDLFNYSIFPPLTPQGNLDIFKNRERSHGYCSYLLSNSFIDSLVKHNSIEGIDEGEVDTLLVMNNGTQSLTNLIEQLIISWPLDSNIKLIVGPTHMTDKATQATIQKSNIKALSSVSEAHNCIGSVGNILARCGYNTLGEIIHTNALGLLVGEWNNPEITSNLEHATEMGYEVIEFNELSTERILNIIDKNKSSGGTKYRRKLLLPKTNLQLGRLQCIRILFDIINSGT